MLRIVLICCCMGVAASVSWAQTPASDDSPVPRTAPAPHPAHESGSQDSEPDESMPAGSSVPSTVSVLAGTDPDPMAIRAATEFVLKATIDGMWEVQLAHVALNNSQNDKVHALAERIIEDHEQANAALNVVATGKNIAVPKEIDADRQSTIRTLSSKKGRDFDAAYAHQMILAHSKDLLLFTAAAGQSDSEIAAFAYKMLPTLKMHQQMAESLKAFLDHR